MEKYADCAVARDLISKYGEDIVSIYTRKQAIADGVLIDLSALYPNDTRIFKYNVACTIPVWEKVKNYADVHGNVAVWDLCLTSVRCKTKIISESEHLFECYVPLGAPKGTIFKIHCGPGDNYEPVLTIMMPWED